MADIDRDVILGDKSLNVLSRVDADDDLKRINSGVALLNVFNYAIQVQGKRTMWLASDYHRFIRALVALDSIGSEAVAAAVTDRLKADVTTARAGTTSDETLDEPDQLEDEDEIQPTPPVRQPSRQAPLSSLPRPPNTIRDNGAIVDDMRMPRR